jgi:predicted Zn-dependent peptidase
MKRPEIHPITLPKIPHHEVITTKHGTPLYTLHNSSQGVVRVSFVFRAGTSYQEAPFSASTVVNTLTEGTQNLSGEQIAEGLDFVGSYYDANIDRDWAVVTFCSLKKFIDPTLRIAEEVILRPTFPEREIASYCAKRKEQLHIQRSKPEQRSRELFGKALFGENHPYGITSSEEAYDRLTPEILRKFYLSHYNAANSFAIICGDFGDEVVEAVGAILEGLPEGKAATREIPPISPVPFASERLEGAVQSSVKIGIPLFPRSHPDFVPMQILATTMGGYFGSRLMQNLREEHGYTYGAYAAMINLDQAGYFVMSAEVAEEHTQEAVEEIFNELERIATEPIGEEELAIVRKIIVGDVMRIFDGPFGAADVTIENIQNGETNDYTEGFMAKVEAITRSELLAVAKRHLQKNNCTVTIIGG